MSLDNIRQRIDLIDAKILKLLNDRMELAMMAKRFKSNIEDPGREKQLLQYVRNRSSGVIDPNFAEEVFAGILKESKRLQQNEFKLIAFQGEHGAYSEVAAQTWNNQFVPIPSPQFTTVFEGVSAGTYDFGIVPVENTLGGVVGQVNDLLISSELFVVGAVEIPIHHCLLAVPDTDHREIRSVYSHPQALSQCRHFLKRNKLQPMPYYDTAGAARWISEEGSKTAAAIASKLTAELYHLEIMKENIEDLDANYSRFLILAIDEFDGAGDKCSIIFSTEHKAGTLFKVLEIFAGASINLTRIESVPSNEPGNYAFFLDFMGSKDDEMIQSVLARVQESTSRFRFMGCYNERKIR